MNERIRELALQAGFWASEQMPFTNREWQELKEEKFAELIVKECAKIAEKEQEFSNQYSLVKINQCILIEFGL